MPKKIQIKLSGDPNGNSVMKMMDGTPVGSFHGPLSQAEPGVGIRNRIFTTIKNDSKTGAFKVSRTVVFTGKDKYIEKFEPSTLREIEELPKTPENLSSYVSPTADFEFGTMNWYPADKPKDGRASIFVIDPETKEVLVLIGHVARNLTADYGTLTLSPFATAYEYKAALTGLNGTIIPWLFPRSESGVVTWAGTAFQTQFGLTSTYKNPTPKGNYVLLVDDPMVSTYKQTTEIFLYVPLRLLDDIRDLSTGPFVISEQMQGASPQRTITARPGGLIAKDIKKEGVAIATTESDTVVIDQNSVSQTIQSEGNYTNPNAMPKSGASGKMFQLLLPAAAIAAVAAASSSSKSKKADATGSATSPRPEFSASSSDRKKTDDASDSNFSKAWEKSFDYLFGNGPKG